MAIPTIFGEQSSPIASYSYNDISEGTGTVIYYGACASTATATYEYLLTKESSFVSAKSGWLALLNNTETTFNFDVNFNLPKYVQGSAFVAVPFYLNTLGSAAGRSAYTKCTFYKWDGATETAISSEITSESFTIGAGVASSYGTVVSKIALTSTQFKRGETLRLKLKANITNGAGTIYAGIGFSPSNQVTGWTSSRLSCFVPFRID